MRKSISKMKRLKVMSRDGFRCICCGESDTLEVDHITPVSLGGDNSCNNLQTLCSKCNSIKRTSGRGWVEYKSIIHSQWNDIPEDVRDEIMKIGSSILGIKFDAHERITHKDVLNKIAPLTTSYKK